MNYGITMGNPQEVLGKLKSLILVIFWTNLDWDVHKYPSIPTKIAHEIASKLQQHEVESKLRKLSLPF